MVPLAVGDVILIHIDAACNKLLQGKQAKITEIKHWGVIAEVPAEIADGVYPVRLQHGDFTPVINA